MKKILLTLFLLVSFLKADITEYFPKLDGRIVDQVNLISSPVKNDINTILEEHEKETSNQIVVVILDSLHDYQIEDYSYQLGRYWGVGQKDKNNGILLVIAMKEKKIRIEVGYGLEGALTDKIAYEIINYTIKPNFKASQYELGILKAINEIILAIKGEYTAKIVDDEFDAKSNELISLGYFAVIFFSIFTHGISRRLRSQLIYKTTKASLFSSFFGFFSFVMAQSFTNQYLIISIIVFAVVFIFNFITSKKVDFDKLPKNNSNNSNNSGGFGGFGSSNNGGFSSSGGGFSGGGGGFGGGGASGGW